MIQEIQLSNFKAFADTVRIPIKPITLIFGPNSAGKTSIFQALLMLKQTLEESENKDQVLLPKGKRVDLGNYREFIHNHDISQSFSVTIKLPPIDLHDAIPDSEHEDPSISGSQDFGKLCKSVENLSIGLTFTFSYEMKAGIHVSKIDLLIGEETKPVLSFVNEQPDEPPEDAEEDYEKRMKTYIIRRNWKLWNEFPKSLLKIKQINLLHPYWQKYVEDDISGLSIDETVSSTAAVMSGLDKLPDEERESATKLLEKHGIISANKVLKNEQDLPSVFKNDCLTLQNFLPVELNGTDLYYFSVAEYANDLDKGNISIIPLAISNIIRKFLEKRIYHIGPVRQHPERYFTFSGVTTTYVGKSGEYLYDILIDNTPLVEAVNKQLSCLNIGYKLKIDPLSSEDSDIKDLYSIRLMNADGVKIAITDVGYGIGQVLPVILQSILSKGKTILVEQPELHLHPAQQAELGDLFINAALGEQKNTFIIETHSEHLLLRIMRRMRETCDNRQPTDIPKIHPKDVMVLFVEPVVTPDDKHSSIVREMPLNERGELVKAWPSGFFEEGLKEIF